MDSKEDEPAFELYHLVFEAIKEKFEVIQAVLTSSAEAGTEDLSENPSAITLDLPSLGHRRVGFYGPRGAGKTTLVNRLIGHELLPTGTESAITASLTHVIPWHRPTYTVTVYWILKEEWETQFEEAKANLEEIRSQPLAERPNGPHPYESFTAQLAKIWGYEHSFSQFSDDLMTEWEKVTPTRLIPKEIYQSWQSGSATVSFNTLEEARHHLNDYTHADEGRFWPLVAKVHVFGPFAHLLAGGFAVLDIPGNEDGNLALSHRYEQGILECDCLFFVPKTEKLISPGTVTELANHPRHVSQFGLVVNHYSELKRASTHDKLRQALRQTCPSNKDYVDAATIFFFENDRRINLGDRDLEEFVTQFRQDDTREVNNRIDLLIDDCNLRLSIIRQNVEGNTTSISEAKKLFQKVIEASSNSIGTLVKTQLPKDPVPLQTRSEHYAALQSHLSNRSTYNRHMAKQTLLTTLPKVNEIIRSGLDSICEDLLTSFDNQKWPALAAPMIQAVKSLRPVLKLVNFERLLENHLAANLDAIDWKLCQRKGKGCARAMQEELKKAWKHGSEQFTGRLIELTCRFAISFVGSQFSHISKQFDDAEKLSGQHGPELLKLLDPITRRSRTMEEMHVEAPTFEAHRTNLIEALDTLVKSNDLLSPLEPIHYKTRDKRGYVYVMTNQSMQGYIKIGETKSLPTERAKQLQTTGVPLPFVVEKEFFTLFTSRFERCMHKIFHAVRDSRRREFFHAPVPLIIQVGTIVQEILEIPD